METENWLTVQYKTEHTEYRQRGQWVKKKKEEENTQTTTKNETKAPTATIKRKNYNNNKKPTLGWNVILATEEKPPLSSSLS